MTNRAFFSLISKKKEFNSLLQDKSLFLNLYTIFLGFILFSTFYTMLKLQVHNFLLYHLFLFFRLFQKL